MNEQKTAVYRGKAEKIHVADGHRADMGDWLAHKLDEQMRNEAVNEPIGDEERTWAQAYGKDAQRLCPGCYMTVLYDAAVSLAKANGQSLTELGRTLAGVFTTLAETGGPERREDVPVQPDPPTQDEPAPQEGDVPYLDGFDPNPGFGYTQPRFDLPLTERDFVFGISSYGLDVGLLR